MEVYLIEKPILNTFYQSLGEPGYEWKYSNGIIALNIFSTSEEKAYELLLKYYKENNENNWSDDELIKYIKKGSLTIL